MTKPPGSSAWMGPFGLPLPSQRLLASALDRTGKVLDQRCGWLLAGSVAGILPLFCDLMTGLSSHALLASVALTPLLAAATFRDSLRCGVLLLGTAFGVHCAAAIALAAIDPVRASSLLPGGEEYWRQSALWIRTGVHPEYELSFWIPAHFQMLAGVVLFAYTSLGWCALWRGFEQVDLMNYYVGQLLAQADEPKLALLLGWHPWSICRGIGFLIVTFEVANLSLSRLVGLKLSTPGRRCQRWLLGLGFLLLDGLLKFTCMEAVRLQLEAVLD